MDLQSKLTELGHELPAAPDPVGAYLPAVRSGNLVVVSGQLPLKDGQLLATGRVPSEVSVDLAKQAAAQCVLNALANVDRLIDGDWARFRRIVRVGAFVNSDDDFVDQAAVANGASELLAAIFGEQGRHARAAVGVNTLPLNASVEVEMMLEIM